MGYWDGLDDSWRELRNFGFRGWLVSHAVKRNRYAHKIQDKTSALIYHMLLLLYCYDNFAYTHWKNEIYDSFLLTNLSVFKNLHRYPDLEFLKHNVYGWLIDSDCWYRGFKSLLKEKNLCVSEDVDGTLRGYLGIIENALEKICVVLVQKHFISKAEYWAILDEAGI